ncbi:MAG TPA: extracellular solute-binding protein [Polyangiaceae bacterium]|nr:extracellular solute-binding protein [Polyangiaceae bacterium]
MASLTASLRTSLVRLLGASSLSSLAAAALVACVAAGCGSTAGGGVATTDAGRPGPGLAEQSTAAPIELFSWWARIGESDALGALTREHQRHYPNDVIINATAELSGLARSTLRTRMQRNEPPDTFQANVGKDLMQWVLVNGLDDRETKLSPLDDVIDDVATWRRTMPKVLIDEVSYDGKLYAVPSNIHRLNTLFYNKKIFETYGLTEPKTIDDLKSMAKKLDGTGVRLIAVGSREPWTLALIAFECMLVAREGPEFYDNYFRGNVRADDPRILADLNAMLDLLSLANDDHAQLSWLQALELVVRGKAALTIMGDWARVSFNARGMKYGQDYAEMPFPQSEDTFVYTSDTFPLPIQAKNRAGAIRLLKSMGSAEGQRVMNAAKGALSARTDVAPENDPMFMSKHALLQRGPLVLALSGLVPPRFASDLGGALSEMSEQRDLEPVVQTLRSRYALLK